MACSSSAHAAASGSRWTARSLLALDLLFRSPPRAALPVQLAASLTLAEDRQDFGEVSQSPHFITRFEWEMGLALNDETGIVRLKGIQNKAVVV